MPVREVKNVNGPRFIFELRNVLAQHALEVEAATMVQSYDLRNNDWTFEKAEITVKRATRDQPWW